MKYKYACLMNGKVLRIVEKRFANEKEFNTCLKKWNAMGKKTLTKWQYKKVS